MNNEKDVKKKVKAILDRFEWFWFMPPANGYGQTGISDFIAIKRGTFLAIETKYGSNKPTPMQVGFLNSIRAADGFAFVVNNKNWEWLEGWCESFDVSVEAMAQGIEQSPDHAARLINAIAELSNRILDTPEPETMVLN